MAPEPGDVPRPEFIADSIVDAILAGRLSPGDRLGEQALADVYGVSRTLIREALGRLAARGMVEVSARRGWFVVQPSPVEAREAFEARLAIETGLLQSRRGALTAADVDRLRGHVADEQAAITEGDAGRRSWLLGDFHVCLAETLGNALLAEILKDLTARTTLIATLYQSTHAASQSCSEHAAIVDALAAGDLPLAAQRLREHIGEVADHLGAPRHHDASLRQALVPVPEAQAPRRRLFTDLLSPASVVSPVPHPEELLP